MDTQEQMTTCFVCDHRYDPDKVRWKGRCPNCNWGGGDGIAEDDPRHMVFLSLAERAEGAKSDESGWGAHKQWLRLEPTAREYALLEQGDQIRVDKEIWRITSKIDDIFWMRRFVAKVVSYGGERSYIAFRHPDEPDDEREEPSVVKTGEKADDDRDGSDRVQIFDS